MFKSLISNVRPDRSRNLRLKRSQTSLLRRLQAQTLPDATQPIDKIDPFINIAVCFEPYWCSLDNLWDLEGARKHSLFHNWKHHLKPFGLGGAVKLWEDKGSHTDLLTSSRDQTYDLQVRKSFVTELELNDTESRLVLDFYLYGREHFSPEELALVEGRKQQLSTKGKHPEKKSLFNWISSKTPPPPSFLERNDQLMDNSFCSQIFFKLHNRPQNKPVIFLNILLLHNYHSIC